MLQQFVDLLPEIEMFLSTRNYLCEELSDDTWLLDLGFLTDLTAKLNLLNSELQGKDKQLLHMMSSVKAFKAKLCVWTAQLQKGIQTHIPNLEKMSKSIKGNLEFHPEQWSLLDVLVS